MLSLFSPPGLFWFLCGWLTGAERGWGTGRPFQHPALSWPFSSCPRDSGEPGRHQVHFPTMNHGSSLMEEICFDIILVPLVMSYLRGICTKADPKGPSFLALWAQIEGGEVETCPSTLPQALQHPSPAPQECCLGMPHPSPPMHPPASIRRELSHVPHGNEEGERKE